MLRYVLLAAIVVYSASQIVNLDVKVTFNPSYQRNTYCGLDCQKFGIKIKNNPLILHLNTSFPECTQYQPGTLDWKDENANYMKSAPKRIKKIVETAFPGKVEQVLNDLHQYYLTLREKCFHYEFCDYEHLIKTIPLPHYNSEVVKEFKMMILEDESLCDCTKLNSHNPTDLAMANDISSENLKIRCQGEFESDNTKAYFASCHELFMKTNNKKSDVFQLANGNKYYCDLTKGWTLVRKMSSFWTINDNLKGEIRVGTPTYNSSIPSDWTLPFGSIPFNKFKFETNDGKKWVIVGKEHVYGLWKEHGVRRVTIDKSHLSKKPVTMFWRKSPSGYPLIRVMKKKGSLPKEQELLYAESDISDQQWSRWRDYHNGINVWIK